MSAEGVGKFIGIIAVHFPKPRFEDTDSDEVIWQASLTRLLGHYDDAVLARAADTIIRTRDRKKDGAFFPIPSECISACDRAKRDIELLSAPKLTVDRQPSGFSPDRHRLALDLLGSELGIEAVRARWHGALYDFIYRNARMPKGSEVEAVKRASREFFEEIEACESGKRGEVSKPLARLGRKIAQRREDYAKSIE